MYMIRPRSVKRIKDETLHLYTYIYLGERVVVIDGLNPVGTNLTMYVHEFRASCVYGI